jgi:hypothetical protein
MPLTLNDYAHFITPAVSPTLGAQTANEGMDVLNRAIGAERNAEIQREGLALRGQEHDLEKKKLDALLAKQQHDMAAARRAEVGEAVDKAMTMALDPSQHDHAMALLRSVGVDAVPFQEPAKAAPPAPAGRLPGPVGPGDALPPAPPPTVADLAGPPNLGTTAPPPKIPLVPGMGAPPAVMTPGDQGGAAALGPLMGDILANPAGAAGLGPSAQAAPVAPAGTLAPPKEEEGGWVIFDPQQGNRMVASFNPSQMRGDVRANVTAFAREIGRGQLNPRFKELADLMAPSVIPMLESQGYDRAKTMSMFKDMVESAFQREQSAENAATVAGARANNAKDQADDRIAARAWEQVRETGKSINLEDHVKSTNALLQATSMMRGIDPKTLVEGAPGHDEAVKNAGTVLAMVSRALIKASGDNRISDADVRAATGLTTESWRQKLEDWFNGGVYGQVGTNAYNNMMTAIDQLASAGDRMALSDYKAMSRVVGNYAPGGRLANQRAYDTIEPYLTAQFTQFESRPWFQEAMVKYGPAAAAERSNRSGPAQPAQRVPTATLKAFLDHLDRTPPQPGGE